MSGYVLSPTTGGVYHTDGEIPDGWRPVVVVDPENAEIVESLAAAVVTEGRGYRIDRAIITVGLKKALRELAAPKARKPSEPDGLGAVVEDAKGEQWVRGHGTQTPWLAAGAFPQRWRDLDVVRVLSEGVTP